MPYAKQTWVDGSGGGTPLSAGRLNVMEGGIEVADKFGVPLFKRKTADESVVSSATFQADNHLTGVGVSANAVYEVDLVLNYTADPGGDLKTLLSMPAAATFIGAAHGPFNSATGTSDLELEHTIATGADSRGGIGAGVAMATTHGILIVAGTAGTVELQWAQRVAHATATVLKAGSFMLLRRVE